MWDIVLLKSEKKSFIRFLLIYMVSTLFLFSLAAWMFYNYEKEHSKIIELFLGAIILAVGIALHYELSGIIACMIYGIIQQTRIIM